MKPTSKAAAGLLLSWAIHDVEELVTLRATSRRVLPLVPEWVPIPAAWRSRGLSQDEVTLAIGLMGALMAIASWRGYRTDGRSWLFRAAVIGYGLHGFGHLASVAALRGYSTGAVTAAVVVIPYWSWARKVLKTDGISDLAGGTLPGGLAMLAVAVPGALGAAHVLLRAASPHQGRRR